MHVEVLPVGEDRMDISIWLRTRSNRVWLTTLKREDSGEFQWRDVREPWESTKQDTDQVIKDSVEYHLGYELGKFVPIRTSTVLKSNLYWHGREEVSG